MEQQDERREVEVACDLTRVTTRKMAINFPTVPKFYKRLDDGRMFPRGLVLFAIVPRGEKSLNLFEVEGGKQDFTDFIPQDDCKREYWLKTHGLRKTAFELMTMTFTEYSEWQPISMEEFRTERDKMLKIACLEAQTEEK